MHGEEHAARSTIRDILTRDFVLGVLSLFGFMTAFYALLPTLPIYLKGLGSGAREIGVLVGAYSASSLASRLFVGRALLRYSGKRVMTLGATVFAITFLACIVVRPFWPFLTIRLFQGIAFACLDTAALAYIVDTIPPKYRGQGIGYFLLAPTFALTVAPSSGIFLINHYNFTVLFIVLAGLASCSLLFASMLKGQPIPQPGGDSPDKNNRFLDLKVVPPAVNASLQNFVWGALGAFFPLYALQCGVGNPGLFFSAMAIMLVIGRTVGGRIQDLYSKEELIFAFIFTAMVAMVILYFSKTLPMFILVGLIWGTATAFLSPVSMAYAFEYAGSSGGAAIGTVRAIMDLGLALGPMIMGMIIPFTGYRLMFLSLALICLINLTYFQFYVRRRS
jgi:MFS family permease